MGAVFFRTYERHLGVSIAAYGAPQNLWEWGTVRGNGAAPEGDLRRSLPASVEPSKIPCQAVSAVSDLVP
jgi:hypothetical protein